MEINAVITTAEHRTVDIRVEDVFEIFWRKIINKFGVPAKAYINLDGMWETWEDTGHGSGIYDTIRKATPEEVSVVGAFAKMREFIRDKYER